MKMKIFMLESEGFSKTMEMIEKNLKGDAEEESLEIKSSTSNVDYIRHLPEGYDLYLLHISNTAEDAIKELREKQSWSKIFVRASSLNGYYLSLSLNSLIDGTYDILHPYNFKTALESIGVKVRSSAELYKGNA